MSEMQGTYPPVQYPVIEALNGVLYLIVFWKYGMSADSLVYCLLFSALLALSVMISEHMRSLWDLTYLYWHWG